VNPLSHGNVQVGPRSNGAALSNKVERLSRGIIFKFPSILIVPVQLGRCQLHPGVDDGRNVHPKRDRENSGERRAGNDHQIRQRILRKVSGSSGNSVNKSQRSKDGGGPLMRRSVSDGQRISVVKGIIKRRVEIRSRVGS